MYIVLFVMALNPVISGLLVPVEVDGPGEYLTSAARRLKVAGHELKVVKILAKSLVSGDRLQFYYEISLVINVPDGY